MSDVGLSLASLASIYAEKGASALPDHLRLTGDSINAKQIKEIFEAADPEHKTLEIDAIPLDEYERETKGDPANLDKDPRCWIVLIQGKGELDLSKKLDKDLSGLFGEGLTGVEADREFVNPGQSVFKWKTVKEYAESVKGRPWI